MLEQNRKKSEKCSGKMWQFYKMCSTCFGACIFLQN